MLRGAGEHLSVSSQAATAWCVYNFCGLQCRSRARSTHTSCSAAQRRAGGRSTDTHSATRDHATKAVAASSDTKSIQALTSRPRPHRASTPLRDEARLVHKCNFCISDTFQSAGCCLRCEVALRRRVHAPLKLDTHAYASDIASHCARRLAVRAWHSAVFRRGRGAPLPSSRLLSPPCGPHVALNPSSDDSLSRRLHLLLFSPRCASVARCKGQWAMREPDASADASKVHR